MKPIPERAPVERLEAELTPATFLRKTNKNDNELYVFTHHNAPYLMEEVGRLREITFRAAGGGTGKALDLDEYDTCENPYHQLIVWDPQLRQILGGYRYYHCDYAPRDEQGNLLISTTQLFDISDDFKANGLNRSIELGRSFVVPDFQATRTSRRSLFALDNLWDGLGALIVDHPEIEYFIGKVTMYTDTPQRMRDLMYNFMEIYFPNRNNWVRPFKPHRVNNNDPEIRALFKGNDYQEDHKTLGREIRAVNGYIPPLINAYMSISPTMHTFGTVVNDHFGDVEDSGILIHIPDIYPSKKDRHVNTYTPNPQRIKLFGIDKYKL